MSTEPNAPSEVIPGIFRHPLLVEAVGSGLNGQAHEVMQRVGLACYQEGGFLREVVTRAEAVCDGAQTLGQQAEALGRVMGLFEMAEAFAQREGLIGETIDEHTTVRSLQGTYNVSYFTAIRASRHRINEHGNVEWANMQTSAVSFDAEKAEIATLLSLIRGAVDYSILTKSNELQAQHEREQREALDRLRSEHELQAAQRLQAQLFSGQASSGSRFAELLGSERPSPAHDEQP